MESKITNADIKTFLDKDTIIVFDTCFWLDIYRNLPENILSILDALKNQLFDNKLYVPYYVKVEFEKNYRKVQGEHKKLNISVKESLSKIANEYSIKLTNAMKSTLERYHIQDTNEQLTEIKDLLDELKNKVDNFWEYDEIEEHLFDWNVSDEVKELFDKFATKNFMNTLSKDDFVKYILDGEHRYKEQVPPGYMDIEKSNQLKFIYGDLLIWMDIIHFACENKRNVLFVTNDVKSDWFENDTFHPKLVYEFQTQTKQEIMGLSGATFLDFINYLKLVPGKVLGGIDSYITNHIDDIADFFESEISQFISEQIIDENSKIYDKDFLTGYDGEYFDCDGDVDIEYIASTYERHENYVEIILKYKIDFEVTTASYSGRDDETKKVYLSPYRTHAVQGIVELKFSKPVIEFYSDLYDIGEIELYSSDCNERYYEDEGDYDEDEMPDHCPKCGCVMTEENYAGNGFCVNCARFNCILKL